MATDYHRIFVMADGTTMFQCNTDKVLDCLTNMLHDRRKALDALPTIRKATLEEYTKFYEALNIATGRFNN